MDVRLAQEKEYIPDVWGNREDANPVKVQLRYLTPGQRRAAFKQRAENKGGQTILVVEIDADQLVTAAVKSISNFTANGKEIKTGRDLLSTPGLDEWVTDIADEAGTMNAKEDGEVKN